MEFRVLKSVVLILSVIMGFIVIFIVEKELLVGIRFVIILEVSFSC